MFKKKDNKIDEKQFILAFVDAMLWETLDLHGKPLGKNYDINRIDSESLTRLHSFCKRFILRAGKEAITEKSLRDTGYYLYLTLQEEGDGFYNGLFPKYGDRLTKICEELVLFLQVYVDNGLIYFDVVEPSKKV